MFGREKGKKGIGRECWVKWLLLYILMIFLRLAWKQKCNNDDSSEGDNHNGNNDEDTNLSDDINDDDNQNESYKMI